MVILPEKPMFCGFSLSVITTHLPSKKIPEASGTMPADSNRAGSLI
jgi:hypothetical protein